jgi:hypothetical protein
MFGLSVFALFIIAAVVLPIVLAVKRSRWRQTQDERLGRLVHTVGELREQVGLLKRRVTFLEDRLGPPEEEAPPIEAEALPRPPEAAGTPPVGPLVAQPPPAPEPAPAPEVPEGQKELVPAVPEPRPPLPTTGVPGLQRKLARLEKSLVQKLMGVPAAPPAAEAAGEPAAVRPPEPAAAAAPARLEQIQQKFMENWTGILGALVVVAGVTFVGIYTALRMAPVYRFMLILAGGGALIGAATVMARKEDWRDLAAWIRSAGAAIVLFACAAAGGLPGLGLQWIEAPIPALGVLLAGIGVNLFLAWSGKKEVFASLHVLLSLVPMAIVPPGVPGLAIASAVALFGVGLAIHGRWDRHLLAVLAAYFAFQALWFLRMGGALDPAQVRLIALGCGAAVFGAGMLAHHFKGYARSGEAPLQIGAHVASTGMLALLSFVYLTDSEPRSAVLLALAGLTWLLARRARGANIPWLYQADVLGGQAFVLLALAGAVELGASFLLVAVVALAELIAFRRLVPSERDTLLDRVVDTLPAVAAVVVFLAGAQAILMHELPVAQSAGLLVAAGALCVAGQWVLRVPAPAPHDSLWRLASPGEALGWLAGGLAALAAGGAMGQTWMEAAALLVLAGLLMANRRAPRHGLGAGAAVGLAGVHLASWTALVAGRDWSVMELSPRIVPLLALAAAGLWLGGGTLAHIGIVLFGADAGLAAYLYFDPVSPLIPGVAWLMLSLVALEIANRLEGHRGTVTLWVGYAYLAAFALAYALVIVQTPAYVAGVRARLLIELFALAVIAYWWFFRPRPALTENPSWLKVHPYFLELLLVGTAISVVVEIPSVWWAVAWALVAIVLLSGPAEKALDARARFYSLVFYWVSVADMATILSVMETPSRAWHAQPQVVSLIAIALQVAYVVHAHYRLELAGLETPAGTGLVRRLGSLVANRRNLYVYYPLFAGVAVFLFWRFDRSVLTLLWSAEAFVVFVLSAWLRENQFRIVALAGLAVCLFRLVLVDMAEANLAVRGVVFIGVGLLMLGMNAIYNRFRARFET